MLKLPTETPSKAYQLRLVHYGVEGLASDIPSRSFPISRIESRRHQERADIVIRLLHDLRNDMVHLSNTDQHIALEELRRYVANCILNTCLEWE